MKRSVLLFVFGLILATQAMATTRLVGRNRSLKMPSDAAAVVANGDTVVIDGDAYSDCATWTKNNLLIKAGTSGVVHVRDAVCGGKAIWVIQGSNVTVEGIEFSDVTLPTDKNAAGIRAEGTNLTIRNCNFHDCDEGILSGPNDNSTITIETSEFSHNGFGDGQSHNMYIGIIKQFILRGCHVHGAIGGHNVKSRAYNTQVLYNFISDEGDSSQATAIDIPQCGSSAIIGNVIERGKFSKNKTLVGYGLEVPTASANPSHLLVFVNNTFINNLLNGGTFVQFNPSATDSLIFVNNLFVGPGTFIYPGAPPAVFDTVTNQHIASGLTPLFKDFAQYDFHLTSGSPCIDAGTSSTIPALMAYMPTQEYRDPNGFRPRPVKGAMDIGAFEYDPSSAVGDGTRTPVSGVMLDVYPNPATTGTTLSFPAATSAHVEIVNAMGQRVNVICSESQTGEWRQVHVDGSTLPAGTYFARMNSAAGIVVKPFAIVR